MCVRFLLVNDVVGHEYTHVLNRTGHLDPPFSEDRNIQFSSIQPAAVPIGDILLQPRRDTNQYLKLELYTRRLDKIYEHLHYAGAPRHARPLHRQVLMDRKITITEDVDEHLVWFRGKIFIKPLNRWLLDRAFWLEHICSNEELHKAACGFVLSYVWLVCRESDFLIGKEQRLLPAELSWEQWSHFQDSFLGKVNAETLVQVSKRYQYGELRLSRLNQIYRMAPSVASARNFVRGYLSPSTWYQEFFRNSFGWLLAVFVYFTVALAGMQLGLAQEDLQRSDTFQQASYGLTIFSLVFVIASVLAILVTWFVLTLFHYTSAKMYHRDVMRERREKISRTELGLQAGKENVWAVVQ